MKELYPSYIPPESLIESITYEHSHLSGMPAASARYFMLQLISDLPGFGVEVHKVVSAQGTDLNFCVGPEGIVLQNPRSKEERW